jgi:hypothetical protein
MIHFFFVEAGQRIAEPEKRPQIFRLKFLGGQTLQQVLENYFIASEQVDNMS